MGKITDVYYKKTELIMDNTGYINNTNDLLTILRAVLVSNRLGFMFLKSNEEGDEVIITHDILRLLKDKGIEIDSLHTLAELFADYSLQYIPKKLQGKRTGC